MDTAHRRSEIVSILSTRRFITSKELAQEFHVSVRTIQNDILALSFDYPIYTKAGALEKYLNRKINFTKSQSGRNSFCFTIRNRENLERILHDRYYSGRAVTDQ
ncbi:MAG: HTH domain-containing protein [Lachnospiraceae bacterium]|nr:HTH domain-containing protein [Lachnospiraceae bacterium]